MLIVVTMMIVVVPPTLKLPYQNPKNYHYHYFGLWKMRIVLLHMMNIHYIEMVDSVDVDVVVVAGIHYLAKENHEIKKLEQLDERPTAIGRTPLPLLRLPPMPMPMPLLHAMS